MTRGHPVIQFPAWSYAILPLSAKRSSLSEYSREYLIIQFQQAYIHIQTGTCRSQCCMLPGQTEHVGIPAGMSECRC